MNKRREQPDALAAEFALGLATGADARRARERALSDPDFRAEVARWRGRLAPLFDDVDAVAPPAGLWDRIERSTAAGQGDRVVMLRRRLSAWRAATAGMTALAASLAVVLLYSPRTQPVAPPPAPAAQAASAPMVAMLGAGDQTKIMASWDPMSKRLVLAVSGDMPTDPSHAHELWVIPAGGQPRSMGTMGAGKQMHMQLADALATLLQQGATIAISVEPPGGSPTGAPTGPVVASGSLTKA